jgi:hypothetical protein
VHHLRGDNGHALALVCFEEKRARRAAAKLLTRVKAHRIAVSIVKTAHYQSAHRLLASLA